VKGRGDRKKPWAVFLDRDGTINEDTGYVSRPEELVLIEGSTRAVKALNDRGVKVIIITNQSGVARGYFEEKAVGEVNEKLIELLHLDGARVDGIYYCPHHPDDECRCRKPETGMIERAAKEHGVEIEKSYVVGDKATDMELARNAGAKGILVMTGQGAEEVDTLKTKPEYVARDLADAVSWILRNPF